MKEALDDGAAPLTLGELMAALGLESSMPLDSEALAARLDAVLSDEPGAVPPGQTDAAAPVRTAEEQALVDRVQAQHAQDALPRWRVRRAARAGAVEMTPDHPDAELAHAQTMEALGLTSFATLSSMLQRLVDHCTHKGDADEARINTLLGGIAAVRPRDELEANLALQMALIHDTMVWMVGNLVIADTLPQFDSLNTAFTKLARTYALQLEALKRLRSTGQQQVVIRRIEVREGGQAMVGALGDVAGRSTPRGKRSRRALPPPEDRLELPLPIDETRSPHPVTIDMNASDGETR